MDMFAEILTALESEEPVILATIVSTTGSTPAAASSKMLIVKEGKSSIGTIGGGCMEGDVLLHANRILETRKPEILTFHLNEDDTETGLICGGSLDVLLEPLTREDIPLLRDLVSYRERGADCILSTFLPVRGESSWKEIIPPDRKPELLCTGRIPSFATRAEESLAHVRKKQECQRIRLPDGDLVLEPVTGMPPLIIFGGGHVSRSLSKIAAMAGFRITVVDDREKYSNRQRFPEAFLTVVSDFAEAFTSLEVTPSTYIVIVTRGHRYDEIVLGQALRTPAAYIGLIGSRRKILTSFAHLRDSGVTDDQLARVSGPVGLDIGAVTAEEIAVSIVAECIHLRRNPGSPLRRMSDIPGSRR